MGCDRGDGFGTKWKFHLVQKLLLRSYQHICDMDMITVKEGGNVVFSVQNDAPIIINSNSTHAPNSIE